MLKDITLGQFFPGKSLLHRLDPRVKIILSLLYIVMVFLCDEASTIILVSVSTLVLILISEIPLSILLKSMKPVLFVLIFTSLFHLFSHDGTHALVEWRFIHIYLEGIYYAVLMAVRIICLLLGSSLLLTYTTSPIMLTDGLERLLSPLKVFHLKVHEFSMMMTIALRFIPTLIEETDKIISAQKARGSDFSSGNLLKRARALIPVLVPLFVSAFRRAGDLATAMECRCYRGGVGRTRMTSLRLGMIDYFVSIAFVALFAGVILLKHCLPALNIGGIL